MNKHELVSHVASGTPVTKAEAERLVGVVFSAIADALACGEPVTIAGFGKFATRSRAARTGRNPRTEEPVAIAASRTPSFKPAKAFATRSTNSRVESMPEPAIRPATSAAAARRAGFDSRSAGAGTFVEERVSPFARAVLIEPDAKFALRLGYTRVRSRRNRHVPSALTVAAACTVSPLVLKAIRKHAGHFHRQRPYGIPTIVAATLPFRANGP